MLIFPEQSSILAADPDKLLETFKRLETLLPKIIPNVFRKALRIQGDGAAGTIAEFVFAPEFAEGRSLKMTTELFDEVNHVLHFDLQLEGDSRYSSFKLHIQLVPGLLEGTTRSQWSFIYEPDNAPPPLDIIATAHPGIVALSSYLQEFRSGSSARAESAECLVETISSLSSEATESLTETIIIPIANAKLVESLTDIILSKSTETAENRAETIPCASSKPVENHAESICIETVLTL